MLTRCPDCSTRFRVTAEQLKARSGRVRCGACQHVFNALDSLIEEPTVVLVAPSATETMQEGLSPSLPDTSADAAAYAEAAADEFAVPPALTPGSMPEALEEVTESPSETPEAPLAESIAPLATEAAEVDTSGSEVHESDAVVEELVAAWSEALPEPPPPPRRWPWVVGSLLAIAALGLQAVLAFRVELAVLWPEARPALVTLCDLADCKVGLPTKVGLVGIESSDLHPDSDHPGRLALAATLKNRAPFAQQFPHLELTLTDTADQAIARKVLAPADYLPPATSIADGMPPNADLMLAVGVEPHDLPASGYRLYLFYP